MLELCAHNFYLKSRFFLRLCYILKECVFHYNHIMNYDKNEKSGAQQQTGRSLHTIEKPSIEAY